MPNKQIPSISFNLDIPAFWALSNRSNRASCFFFLPLRYPQIHKYSRLSGKKSTKSFLFQLCLLIPRAKYIKRLTPRLSSLSVDKSFSDPLHFDIEIGGVLSSASRCLANVSVPHSSSPSVSSTSSVSSSLAFSSKRKISCATFRFKIWRVSLCPRVVCMNNLRAKFGEWSLTTRPPIEY